MATGPPKRKKKLLDGDPFFEGCNPPLLSFAHVYIPYCFKMEGRRLECGWI